MAKGIVAVILASILFGLSPIFSKNILDYGVSSGIIVMIRFFFSIIITMVFSLFGKTSFRVTKKQVLHLAIFGISGSGLTAYFLNTSYLYIPVGLATMFHFSYPLVVTIIMVVLFKEKLTFRKYLALLLSGVGLVLMADFKGGLSVTGVIFALLSGITYACYIVAMKKSAFSTLPPFIIIFYVSVFCFLTSVMENVLNGTFVLPKQACIWINLFVLSLFSTILAMSLLTFGVKAIGAINASVINMIEPLTSIILGSVIFNERLSWPSIYGCILMVVSVLLITFGRTCETAQYRTNC